MNDPEAYAAETRRYEAILEEFDEHYTEITLESF